MVSSIDRLPNLERLIEQQNYFVIHAPRQTGKSTAMMALTEWLMKQGMFLAVLPIEERLRSELHSTEHDRQITVIYA